MFKDDQKCSRRAEGPCRESNGRDQLANQIATSVVDDEYSGFAQGPA